jgi:hypothetical protein
LQLKAEATRYYGSLFGDLCESAQVPVDHFITVLFFGGGIVRRLTDAVEAEHPLHPLGHARLPLDIETASSHLSSSDSLSLGLGAIKISGLCLFALAATLTASR